MGILRVVFDDEHSHQPGEDVQSRDSHRVVVIPERRGVLLVGIMTNSRLPGCLPVFRIAVTRGRTLCAVDMDDSAHLGLVGLSAVQSVIDGEKVLPGKLIDPFDQNALPGAGRESGARNAAPVTPQACWWQVTMQPRGEFGHGHPVERELFPTIDRAGPRAGSSSDGGYRQSVGEPFQCGWIQLQSRWGTGKGCHRRRGWNGGARDTR